MSVAKNGKFWLKGLVLVLSFSALVAATWAIAEVRATNSVDTGHYEELKAFTEVINYVRKNYVEEVDTGELVYGAIKGMLSSLDPHSGFLTPEAYKEMQVDTRGEFGGLGIQISIKDGFLTIVAPIEDTPAWEVGLKAQDRIVTIEKEPTKDMTLHDAVSKMRGKKGTSVTIGVVRNGWKAPRDFTIVRDIIKIQSVKGKMLKDGVAHVKITQFQERTAEELSKKLAELDTEGMKALVLDLRNNPGGLLNSAVEVSSRFLEPGVLVVYIKGRDGERSEYHTYGSTITYTSMPMIVLINPGSASASEIVAGAVKDHKRGVILGEKSFGKGSVQSVIPLSDGSAVRLTTARYYTPDGISIQNTGIEPDIEVKLQAKNGEEAHPVIREGDLKGRLENEQVNDSGDSEEQDKAVMRVEDEEDDTQLTRAVDLLKTWSVFKGLGVDKPLKQEEEADQAVETAK